MQFIENLFLIEDDPFEGIVVIESAIDTEICTRISVVKGIYLDMVFPNLCKVYFWLIAATVPGISRSRRNQGHKIVDGQLAFT